MIHYHGTPCGATREDVARFLAGRHALIPWVRNEDIGTAAEVCESFCFDNGAYSAWKSGEPITDWKPYYEWVNEWSQHPGFDFAFIPDVIDGDEAANDALHCQWFKYVSPAIPAVPVWHFHESLTRLERLVRCCKTFGLGLGSSGEFKTPGTERWWKRIGEAMAI